jgi:hypothetical protein
MFGKKKETTSRKTKKLTQREIMTNIEQLGQGEALSYRLPEAYGGQLAVVEFNTMYPWRGHKYILSTQTMVEGKADWEKTLVLESDEAKDIAAWVSRRRGSSYPSDQAVPNEAIADAIRS